MVTHSAATFESPARATTPPVKSSESPGKMKPTSNPVSANTMPNSIAYPGQLVRTVERNGIRRSGVQSVLMNSMMVCSMRPAKFRRSGAITRHQAPDRVVVLLHLALFDQLGKDAVVEQLTPLTGLFLLQCLNDSVAAGGELAHVGGHLSCDLRHNRAVAG